MMFYSHVVPQPWFQEGWRGEGRRVLGVVLRIDTGGLQHELRYSQFLIQLEFNFLLILNAN